MQNGVSWALGKLLIALAYATAVLFLGWLIVTMVASRRREDEWEVIDAWWLRARYLGFTLVALASTLVTALLLWGFTWVSTGLPGVSWLSWAWPCVWIAQAVVCLATLWACIYSWIILKRLLGRYLNKARPGPRPEKQVVLPVAMDPWLDHEGSGPFGPQLALTAASSTGTAALGAEEVPREAPPVER